MFSSNSLPLPQSLGNSCISCIIKVAALVTIFGPFVAFGQGTGYWHTSGSQILDSRNKAVRITGINWYGFETTDAVVHGLYAQDYHTVLNTIQAEGFNTVRLPFSNQMVETPIVPSSISFSGPSGPINGDLAGLNSLQIMDKVIAAAGRLGLRVILDNHRSEAGNSNEASGLWYTSAYPESNWIADWSMLVNRYKSYTDSEGDPTVIGVDLRNEPHLIGLSGFTGSCWTGDTNASGCPTSNTAQNWPAAAGRAANAILKLNPSLIVFVEGTDCYNGQCGWQGANLEGAGKFPVETTIAHQLAYSAHDYGPDLYRQLWFTSSTTEASLITTWNKYWGYLSTENTAPVWVGEFGTTNNSSDVESNTPGSQGQWFQSLVSYLGNNPNIQWTYWALNGEDEFGLLDNGYDPTPASSLKEQLLHSVQFSLVGETAPKVCSSAPAAPTGLIAFAGTVSAITVNWGAVTPPANCAVTYSVYRSTASTFTPSSANLVKTTLTGTEFADSGLAAATKYSFIVEASDSFGNSKASAITSAMTAKPCTTVPATPVGLTASAISATSIAVNWSSVSPPANCGVTYNVYRGSKAGFIPSAANLVSTGSSSNSYTDAGLTAGTKYDYIIGAVDQAGASKVSEVVSATTLGASIIKPETVSCHVTYSVVNDWGSGFQASISITNTGGSTISSWNLGWTFPQKQVISSAWNTTETQSGETVTMTNMGYNGTIAASGTLTGIGFVANYTGTNTAPAQFSLNGVACK